MNIHGTRISAGLAFGFGALALGVAGTTAMAVGPEVIYTKIPTHPSSIIPGALDSAGNPVVTNFRALENLYLSPDGSRWVISARTQQGSDNETILLLGSGTTGTMFLQEGRPVPDGASGEIIDFFGSGVGRFNELNQFAFTLRARGGSSGTLQKVVIYSGGLTPTNADFQIVGNGGNAPAIGDLYAGLQDLSPNPSGDETMGNSIGSIHILNSGAIGAQDSTILNIHTSRRPAIFYGGPSNLLGGHYTFNMFKQVGVSTFLSMDGEVTHTYAPASGGLGSNTFYTTPDGKHWLVHAQIAGAPTTSDAVLVVDGQTALQEGVAVPGSTAVVSTIVNTDLAASGDWYSRGALASGGVWAAHNGALVAQTGDPISDTESWGASFYTFTGNSKGDWVLIGKTNNPDPAIDDVVVVNGVVVLREGDPIDLNGNGLYDDNVFIGRGVNSNSAFEPNDAALTEDGMLYLFVDLRDGQGNDLNSNPSFGTPQAFIRLQAIARPLPCPADIVHDGAVNVSDLLAVINGWGSCPQPCPPNCAADINHDCAVNVSDLLAVINGWGACP